MVLIMKPIKYMNIDEGLKEAYKARAKGEKATILDVRTIEEYKQGHFEHGVNLPLDDIGLKKPDEMPDKDQTLYIYCRSGVRSKVAAELLFKMGYSSIVEIGGIIDTMDNADKIVAEKV